MQTKEEEYGERLRRGPSVVTVVVRVVYAAVTLLLAVVALLIFLQNTAYNRAETAFYHLADELARGEEPRYDRRENDASYIDAPEKLGLSDSALWKTTARVNSDSWITAECKLCSPLLEGLGIEITASFPATGVT